MQDKPYRAKPEAGEVRHGTPQEDNNVTHGHLVGDILPQKGRIVCHESMAGIFEGLHQITRGHVGHHCDGCAVIPKMADGGRRPGDLWWGG